MQMCVKTDDKLNSVTYQRDFFAPASSIDTDWTQIDLPFDEFTATWRAQLVSFCIFAITWPVFFFLKPASSIDTKWAQIDVPFAEFTATWRAQLVSFCIFAITWPVFFFLKPASSIDTK
jgi:hypothetical protein